MGNAQAKTREAAARIFDIVDDGAGILDTEELAMLFQVAPQFETAVRGAFPSAPVRKVAFINAIEALPVPPAVLRSTLANLQDVGSLMRGEGLHRRDGYKAIRLPKSRGGSLGSMPGSGDAKSAGRAMCEEHTINADNTSMISDASGSTMASSAVPRDCRTESLVTTRGEGEDTAKTAGKFSKFKYGRVLKCSGGLHVGSKWQDRSLYLSPESLMYFKAGRPRPMGHIRLVLISQVKVKGRNFEVDIRKRTFDFRCDTPEEAECWAEAIQTNINDLGKRESAASGASERKSSSDENKKVAAAKFWKVEPLPQVRFQDMPAVSFREVMASVNSGDILLFQSKGVGPGIVRSVTKSVYDHVAVFVRMGGKLGCLEALGDPGCLVSEFAAFCTQGWHDQYTAMSIRRLDPPLTREAKRELRRFCRGVKGRRYGISAAKLMRRRGSTMSFDDKERTYFCSELVAKAYKHLELLRSDCPSSDYFPCSFAVNENVPLMFGYTLGVEERITFPKRRKRPNK